MLMPSKEQVYDLIQKEFTGNDYDFQYPNALLKEFAAREKILYLDLTPYFRDYANQGPEKGPGLKKDLYFKHDQHWNEAGNRLAGLVITYYLLEKSLIDTGDNEKIMDKILQDLKKI